MGEVIDLIYLREIRYRKQLENTLNSLIRSYNSKLEDEVRRLFNEEREKQEHSVMINILVDESGLYEYIPLICQKYVHANIKYFKILDS